MVGVLTLHLEIVMKGLKLTPEHVHEALSTLKYSHLPHTTLEAIKSIMPTKEEVRCFYWHEI